MHIEGAGEALKVVLGVYQVFDAHLAKSKELDEQVGECFVAEPLHVGPVKVGVCDVLQQCLELAQISLLSNRFDVSVHNLRPVEAPMPLLELEFWRYRRIEPVI